MAIEARMITSRRQIWRCAIGAAALPLASQPFGSRLAAAPNYPARPVHVVVTVPAGGSPDIVARLLGQWLSERLAQPFVIENRPGASANIGTEYVVRAAPDGHTLLVAMSANAINASLYPNLNYNFIRDTVPVALSGGIPLVLVATPALPTKTVPELIAYAKANPGKINMASAGKGTPLDVAGELFKMMAGVEVVSVTYQGESPAIPDLLSGQMQIMFGVVPASLGYIKSGRLRALAVTTAARQGVLPDVPAMSEFLPDSLPSAGMASRRRRTRRLRLSISSTKKSMTHCAIAKSKSGWLNWASAPAAVRLAISLRSSLPKPRSGPRW